MRFVSVVWIGLLAGAPAFGCNGDDADDEMPSGGAGKGGAEDGKVRLMVGELTGSDVKFGVIATEEKARLYFCGGPDSVEDSTRWLVVPLEEDGSFEFEDESWRLRGQMDSAELSGEVERVDGKGKGGDFLAELIDSDTVAGVYEGTDQCGKVGLIVTQPTPDDEATGQGACVGAGHDPEPVGVILPIEVDEDGMIEVELGEGDEKRPASVIMALPP
jgi:hypothetical protein